MIYRASNFHDGIKPVNILYKPESYTVKITELGQNSNGTVLDTPSDSSQEWLTDAQFGGDSDLQLLGVMLLQMIVRSLVIKAEYVASQICELANEGVPDIRTKHTDFSGRLAININRALNKNFNHRFPTGMELAGEPKATLNS